MRLKSVKLARGLAQKTLYLRELSGFIIFIPPLQEQRRFAKIVESVKQQKAKIRTHLAELDTLCASLQLRAFGGDL